jgi:hypothetical protein
MIFPDVYYTAMKRLVGLPASEVAPRGVPIARRGGTIYRLIRERHLRPRTHSARHVFLLRSGGRVWNNARSRSEVRP